jgi:DNA-directed RNA polymerase specialized sigma24 family protein
MPEETATVEQFEVYSIFWDMLKSFDKETALYCVLRYCLGYSRAEIAAGFGVTEYRVRLACDRAKKYNRIK